MSVQTERRRHPRLALAGKQVVVSSEVPGGPRVAGELHDVSRSGIRWASPSASLDLDGREVVIEFQVPALWWRRVLRLPARLVRSGPEPSIYAFELTAATGSREARRLEAFLNRVAAANRRAIEDRPGIDRQVEEALHMVQLGLPRLDESRPRVVVLTSPTPETTGFLAAGLAVVLAGQGGKVIAVDLDAAHPVLHRLLGVGRSPGIANWLESGVSDREIGGLARLGLGGVRVLPAGDPNPSRLSRGRMAIASLVEGLRHTDARFVLINAPACLVSADAAWLSELADDVLLVLRADTSSEAEVVEAGALLERHRAPLRGVILMDAQSHDWSSRVRPLLRPLTWLARRRASRADVMPRARSQATRRDEFTDVLPARELGVDDSR